MKANRLALFGIVLGVTGAVLLALFVATAKDDSPSTETRQVLVAADNGIPAGSTSDQLPALAELRALPVEAVPAHALATLDTVEGQRAARTIGPGEVLTSDQFGVVGPSVGGVIVPEGWEAVSVEANPAPGLEGYATPGSLINLYATITPVVLDAEGNPDPVASVPFTQLIMGHTEVLAVTRGTLTGEAVAVENTNAAGSLVFLLKVRPADVPTLVHAEQSGQLWFSLASAQDPSPVSQRVTLDSLDPAAITQAINEARTQLEEDRAREEQLAAGVDEVSSR